MAEADPQPEEAAAPAPSLWQTTGSVLAAFFGVQSRANRERDFRHGRPLHFILIGLAATLGFIGVMVLAVRFALRLAGS